MKHIRNIFRNLQTNIPALQDFRFILRRRFHKIANTPHENDFNALSLFNIPKNSLFIDIGANRGEAIQSILLLNNECNIVAFEPNELIFKKLTNIFMGFENVKLHCKGLGSKNGKYKLYVPFYKKFMFDGLASFSFEEASNWLRNNMFNYKDKHLKIREFDCVMEKLDNFGFQAFFIKIDVQGFELQTLIGGRETIEKYKPILLIETPQQEISDFLTEFGYKHYTFYKSELKQTHGKLNTYYFTDFHFSLLK